MDYVFNGYIFLCKETFLDQQYENATDHETVHNVCIAADQVHDKPGMIGRFAFEK